MTTKNILLTCALLAVLIAYLPVGKAVTCDEDPTDVDCVDCSDIANAADPECDYSTSTTGSDIVTDTTTDYPTDAPSEYTSTQVPTSAPEPKSTTTRWGNGGRPRPRSTRSPRPRPRQRPTPRGRRGFEGIGIWVNRRGARRS